MPAQGNTAVLPSVLPVPLRWVVIPALGWAAFAAVTAILRKRVQRPSLPPMSDDWLRSNAADAGRHSDY